MKNSGNLLRKLFFAAIVGLLFQSCKKDNAAQPSTDNFPAPISNMVSQSMVDSIRNAGGMVNSGTSPAIINGIYLMSPDSCIFDNSPGNFAGTIFVDYKFRFSNQDNSSYAITVDQKNQATGTLSQPAVSTFISGNGNKISVFLHRTMSPGGIQVDQFNVLSGTLTSNGIQNLQNILYIRSKGNDPGNTVPPAGTIRVFVTGGSGLASNSTTF